MTADRDDPWGRYPDRRSARRAAVRRHHPDIGGSAHDLEAAVAAIDRRFGISTTTDTGAEVSFVRTRRGRIGILFRPTRRVCRQIRTRLPGAARHVALHIQLVPATFFGGLS